MARSVRNELRPLWPNLRSVVSILKCFRWYRERHGSRCWELDALSPVVLRERVEQAIVERLDLAGWKRAEVIEHAERDSLTSILTTLPGISGQASKYGERQP